MSDQKIGIAIIRHSDHFLVGIRPNDVPLAGLAEFPGGKCEPGETPQDCVLREALEETGLVVEPFEELCITLHEYPHGSLELHFWCCRLPEGVQIGLHEPIERFHWVPRGELPRYSFPDGNREVLKLLLKE